MPAPISPTYILVEFSTDPRQSRTGSFIYNPASLHGPRRMGEVLAALHVMNAEITTTVLTPDEAMRAIAAAFAPKAAFLPTSGLSIIQRDPSMFNLRPQRPIPPATGIKHAHQSRT